ncbi:response regulator transcription factor [Nonomuraea sp. NN258]|uniref:response regulator transcription factor n=1 Tax=Nonomuraea antri TaxID=2730852 RepID=UPI0015685AE8|nr:response regulator transcription factor [Nonomuraea antri]NRQ37611.1 response regulator transcription factor [Nonomuraea antri]
MTRILVVEDEPYLADLVATALRYEDYEVTIAATGSAALALAAGTDPHLIVLDVLLPDVLGTEVCRRLRAGGSQVPVIFLTARDSTDDRIGGLSAGGDDYVTKPFSLEELTLRIKAVLRRTRHPAPPPAEPPPSARVSFADLVVDDDTYEVFRAGQPIDLTPTEFKLLRFLLDNAGKVLTKRQILDHVWEYDFGGNDGVVQTYISYLRRKIDRDGPPLIHTKPRIGYVLRLPGRP